MKTLRGFRYPMEALRRKREWELEAARLELAQATRAAAEVRAHVEALEVRFATARMEAAKRSGAGAAFSLHAHRIAATYFTALSAAIVSAREALRRHDDAREQCVARVREAHAALSAVERHRDSAHAEHARDAGRRELALADELWTNQPEGDPA